MKQDTKRTFILCTLLILYIILAILGVYNVGSASILPILSVPYALHIAKNNYSIGIHALYNVTAGVAIFSITGGVESVIIYIIGIGIPAYAASCFYKKKLSLPSIIIYTAIINASAMLLYQVLMKVLGVNYELQYILYTEKIKTVFIPILMEQVANINGMVDKNFELQLTETLINNFELIKQLFSSLLIINAFVCTTIQVLIMHGVLRIKDKSLPKFGELLEFRVSKVVILFLVVAMTLVGTASNASSGTVILGVNVLVVTYMLFMILGLLSMIGLIRKSSVNKGMKVMSSIFLVIIIMFAPTLLILNGFLDTLFNFRKVTLVV